MEQIFNKEQQEKALPKFKYYAKLMAELKKTLDEEVKIGRAHV